MAGGVRDPYRINVLLLLVLILLGSSIIALGTGAVYIAPGEILAILGNRILLLGGLVPQGLDIPDSYDTIVFQLRLPRILLSLVVGSSLALSGAAFQGLFKNPMADPFVIGVSSGGALGATIALALGLQVRFLALSAVPLFAFAGALLTLVAVYNLARTGNRVPVMTLLLAGIAISSFFSALVSLLTYLSDQRLHQIVYWMMGSLSGRGWEHLLMVLPYYLVGLTVIASSARALNALLLGEEPAQHLGIEVERVKKHLLFAASLLTGSVVAVSGMIGFVGLVIPHVVRLILGPDHRALLPAVILTGGTFLLWADTLSRVLLPPLELPVGLITSLVGGPFFIYLLRKRRDSLF